MELVRLLNCLIPVNTHEEERKLQRIMGTPLPCWIVKKPVLNARIVFKILTRPKERETELGGGGGREKERREKDVIILFLQRKVSSRSGLPHVCW